MRLGRVMWEGVGGSASKQRCSRTDGQFARSREPQEKGEEASHLAALHLVARDCRDKGAPQSGVPRELRARLRGGISGGSVRRTGGPGEEAAQKWAEPAFLSIFSRGVEVAMASGMPAACRCSSSRAAPAIGTAPHQRPASCAAWGDKSIQKC